NLRYTLSECMFAYPAEIVSISSHCQITCAPLQDATTYQIDPDVGTATANTPPTLDFCNQYFDDNALNNCSFCYSMIPQQLFLANFVQALHIACRDPPVSGQTFYPNGQAIFNETLISGPAPPGSAPSLKSVISGWQLAVVVVVPSLVVLALLALGCLCCFNFTKRRRVKMAASGRMTKFHDYAQPSVYGDNQSQYEWPQPDQGQEMEHIHYVNQTPKNNGKQRSPGLAQRRWSQHIQGEEDVPLSAVPKDNIGPGQGQNKDPFLHEQYFGDEAGPSTHFPPPSPGGANSRHSWQQR
ncbi:hypothetical protein LTR66_015825, partial [Elasticomyces elasticus]